jgi:hypothetical protein
VERVGEVDDRLAAGDLPGELERRLHRVGTRRARELHLVVEPARREHDLLERAQELRLGRGVHVQAVGDAVARQVVDQRFLQRRRIVPVVQRTGTGEEVQVGLAVDVGQAGAAGGVEDHRPGSAVAAHLGFDVLEHGHCCTIP